VTLEDAIYATPQRIARGDYTKIDAEGDGLCALRADRGIECTGGLAEGAFDLSEVYDEDAYDELEEEAEPFAFGGPLWTMIDFPGKAIDIAVGEDHACYLSDAGIVRCWGNNKEGQLGDGTTRMRTGYVTVVDLKDVVEISAGDGHTCARDRGGQVRCWGAWTGPRSAAKIDAPTAVVGLTPFLGAGDLDAPAPAEVKAKSAPIAK
jgi:alpha-tubulin suppressor-like RCC1 family protein